MSGDFCIIVGTWTGMKNIASIFMWVSNLNIGPQSLSFVRWIPHEPTGNIGGVSLKSTFNYKWNDAPESYDRYFVCKKVFVDLCCTRKGGSKTS
jgi:hypothetical protein